MEKSKENKFKEAQDYANEVLKRTIDPFQHGEEKFKKIPKSDVYTDTHNDYDGESK